ncbi:MAG: DNA replication/repair protein RecF [Synoicihabitans sp.]
MRIQAIGLQHFRNITAARLEFSGRLQFFVGPNGQGKTNLLEAAGFVTALRSFRSADHGSLIQQGNKEAAIACDVEHDHEGASQLTVSFKSGAKTAWLDGEKITRLGDIIGRFPSVVFSSQDQQLVRGAPAGRRRWLDLTLSATDASYLASLQAYHRALAERNALLKRDGSTAEFQAFETVMAEHGFVLVERRTKALAELATVLMERYAQIADRVENVGFAYAPQMALTSADELVQKLAQNRQRDQIMKSTGNGPHRDDFEFTLERRLAKDIASEGQQRALVLSLRLAQAAWFAARTGVQPALLADDVLGELDPARRERFWSAVSTDSQVIATGTVHPGDALGNWQVFDVEDGRFSER